MTVIVSSPERLDDVKPDLLEEKQQQEAVKLTGRSPEFNQLIDRYKLDPNFLHLLQAGGLRMLGSNSRKRALRCLFFHRSTDKQAE